MGAGWRRAVKAAKATRECYCNSKRHSPKSHPVEGCIVAECDCAKAGINAIAPHEEALMTLKVGDPVVVAKRFVSGKSVLLPGQRGTIAVSSAAPLYEFKITETYAILASPPTSAADWVVPA